MTIVQVNNLFGIIVKAEIENHQKISIADEEIDVKMNNLSVQNGATNGHVNGTSSSTDEYEK